MRFQSIVPCCMEINGLNLNKLFEKSGVELSCECGALKNTELALLFSVREMA